MNLNLGDTQMIIEAGRKAGLLRNQLAYVLEAQVLVQIEAGTITTAAEIDAAFA